MADDDTSEVSEGKAQSGKLKIIIIIVVGILLVAGLSVFVTWFLLKDKLAQPDGESTSEMDMADAESVEMGPAMYYRMDPAFIINYISAGKSRFLQVELSLLTRDAEVIAVLENHDALIRHKMIEVFSDQDITMLNQIDGKEKLAEDLASSVQAILDAELGRPGIETVLYRSFIIQ